MKPAVLTEIAEFTRKRVAEQKLKLPFETLLSNAKRRPQPFARAFEAPGYHVIAEIKRASPSEGPIALGVDPVTVAFEYLSAGARALSVLTEPRFFKGDVEFLAKIRAEAPEARLLMKDFVLERYQLAQARYFGADAVLLIVSLLGKGQLASLLSEARALGLETLVEVHDETELKIAADVGATLIGINNRNLKTMKVSLETSERLAPLAPQGSVLIAESGLSTPDDLKRLRAKGFHGFLIGTAFMKSGEPGAALARTLGELL